MDNIYDIFPFLKNELNLFEIKRFIIVFVTHEMLASYVLTNSIYDYFYEIYSSNFSIVFIAFRKSGKIYQIITSKK